MGPSLGSHLIPLGPIALVSRNDTVASRVLGGGAGIARACKQGRRAARSVYGFHKLRIHGRMHIFEKKSQSALNHVLILQKYRTQKMLQIPLKIIDLQNDFNILVAKQWKIIISVPTSYMNNLYKKKTIIIIKQKSWPL